jgi:hypothetical protein
MVGHDLFKNLLLPIVEENWVLAVRPMSEPAPQPADYRNSEVIFEVQKGSSQLELALTAPSTWTQFSDLSEAEKQHSLLVICYPDCPLAGIRRQLHVWRGIPVHYLIEETEDSRYIVQ